MAWYSTGTVSVVNGSNTVTAQGTQFVGNVKPGDIFAVVGDPHIYEVDRVISATELTIKRPYAGEGADAVGYDIIPSPAFLKSLAGQVADLIALYQAVPQDAANAAASADAAAKSEAAANTSATAAASSRDAAATSATAAADSAQAAALSESRAATSEANAATSQSAAASSASAAKTSETNAAASAAAAKTSETNAKASADAAASSQSAASGAASNAKTSETNAAASQAAAATSASNAKASEANAAASRDAAATSAANAKTAEANAAASANSIGNAEANAKASAAAAAQSAADAAASAAKADYAMTGALTKDNNLSDVSNKASARTNLGLGSAATQNTGTSGSAVPLLDGANTWSGLQKFSVRPVFNGATPWDSSNFDPNSKVSTAGATMTDDLRVKQPDGTQAKGLILARQDGTAQAWIHGSMSTAGPYGYTSWATMNTDGSWRANVITVMGADNSCTIANLRANNTAYFGDRIVIGRDGWQADLALQNRRAGVGASTVYLRASDNGGFELINNAYNAVIFRVDDWGNVMMRGQSILNTDGNLYCAYRGMWMNGILDDLYARDNTKIDWNTANDRWNQTVQRDPGNTHRYSWDGGARHINMFIDGQGIAYVAANWSDMRLKTNIAPTEEDSLAKIKALKFKQFDWRADGKHQSLGIIAQQAKTVDESFVYQAPGDPLDVRTNPMMLETNALLLTALHAIQQLSAEVDALKAQLTPAS
ncbi:tail fiber domain-containing protein [Burkholderia multivorans]|uniref:tail fiber domain-containing protein n=1 Tax=Burkholderia multivorans TaxID=87883 RepID=UPI0021C046EC|nr:tail fiber domain-containing protein [Burkholderia multivorans]